MVPDAEEIVMKNEEEKTLLEASVLFLETENEICMGEKLQKIGAGFLNGIGGGPENGEDEFQCTVREAFEEWNIMVPVHRLRKVAVINMHNRKSTGETFTCRLHIFFTRSWIGKPEGGEEVGTPQWFLKTSPPLEHMIPGDRAWLPQVLSGRKIVGDIWHGPKQQTLDREPELRDATEEDLDRLHF